MGKHITKAVGNVFAEARYNAATFNDRLFSREGASEELGIDRSRLARIELGSKNPFPDEVLMISSLESGYASDQKEFQVEIRGKEYKILKRDAVTVFYDEAGNTLFDVTNDRLEKEYNSLTSAVEEEQESDGHESSVGKAIEAIDRGTLDAAASEEDKNTEGDDFVPMGKASLADIMTGNIPDPTPEEVETAKKANAGDIQAKAKQKLEDEVKEAKDKEFADPIISHLIKRCEEDPGLAEDIIQEHKTWIKCFTYIRSQAKKQAKGNCAVIRDDLVYEWAEDYFRLDDKALEEKKEKERKEREAKNKAEAAKRKSGSGNQKKKTNPKKAVEEKKISEPEKKSDKPQKNKEPEGQMSLFDLL